MVVILVTLLYLKCVVLNELVLEMIMVMRMVHFGLVDLDLLL